MQRCCFQIALESRRSFLDSRTSRELRASAASSLVKDKDEEKMFDASSNSGAHLAHPSRFGLATTPLLSMA